MVVIAAAPLYSVSDPFLTPFLLFVAVVDVPPRMVAWLSYRGVVYHCSLTVKQPLQVAVEAVVVMSDSVDLTSTVMAKAPRIVGMHRKMMRWQRLHVEIWPLKGPGQGW